MKSPQQRHHHPVAGISPRGFLSSGRARFTLRQAGQVQVGPSGLIPPFHLQVVYILPRAAAPINKPGLPVADVKPIAACMPR